MAGRVAIYRRIGLSALLHRTRPLCFKTIFWRVVSCTSKAANEEWMRLREDALMQHGSGPHPRDSIGMNFSCKKTGFWGMLTFLDKWSSKIERSER